MTKRLFCVLLTALMLLELVGDAIPALPVSAVSVKRPVSEQIATIYRKPGEYIVLGQYSRRSVADQDQEALETAADALRNGMKARETEISIEVFLQAADPSEAWNRVWDMAMEHTGDPQEGDYLAWHWSSCGGGIDGYPSTEGMYLTFTYTVSYYTDATQETELDEAVEDLLADLDLWEATDYEKVQGIYDYLCQNVAYDYDNLKDDTYDLKYSAYAALVNGTSVCQGYALLFYRLALSLGVDTRFVGGTAFADDPEKAGGHAWNIVELDNQYYNLDATWDRSWYEAGYNYEWFLRCDESFPDHQPDAQYLTEEFLAAYPISETDYAWNDPPVDSCDHSWADATCTIPKTCSLCGATEGEALGHDYTTVATEVTCTSDGYTTYTCHCGYSYVDDYMSAAGHSYVNGICTVCEHLDAYTALEDFEHSIDGANKTVTLTKYVGTDAAVIVPAYYVIDGVRYTPVLKSDAVFSGNTTITSVTLRADVCFAENTMYKLFAGCSNLTTVDMTGVDTSYVTSMRELFSLCKKLTTIIGYENWDTGNVESLFKAFNYVFYTPNAHGQMENAVIDLSRWDLSNVKNTGWCFQYCYATEILLPDNLAVMSAGFFNHAAKVAGTSYIIPKGVKKIGYAHTIYDFATDDFVEFIVAEGNAYFKAVDGILYSADGTEMLAIPRNKAFENGVYEIPEGVTFLGELSFSRNYNIETLILPDSYVIECIDLYDDRYIIFEDIGNINVGTNLTIAIYCYTGIKDYVVKETNPNYQSVDGIIYSEDMTTVVAIPTRYGRVIAIPEGVTTWNKQAMWNDTEVADLHANNAVDKLLSACGGVNLPSTLVSIDKEQVALINRLKYKYGSSFVITVHEDNPAYCVDVDGYLQLHSYESGICTHCKNLNASFLLSGDLDLDGDADAEDLTMLARHVAGIEEITNAVALANADVDGNGDIDANDLTMHARYVAGIITVWPDKETAAP